MTGPLLCEYSGRAFDPDKAKRTDRGYYATCPACGTTLRLTPANGWEWRLPEHQSPDGDMAAPDPCTEQDPWRPDSLGHDKRRLPTRSPGENTGPLADLLDAVPVPWSNHKAEKVARASGRARPEEPLAERCEVAIEGTCTGKATDRHHILPRAAGGGDERANTLDCCRACHLDGIHGNPARAYERGWLRRRSAA